MDQLPEGGLPSQTRQRARAWRVVVWGNMAVGVFFALLGPLLLLPVPPAWAYATMLPVYAVCFGLGWARYRKPRDNPEDPLRKPLSRRMKSAYGVAPAIVITVMAVLRPDGPVFKIAISTIVLPLMFSFGAIFASRNRVPRNFQY